MSNVVCPLNRPVRFIHQLVVALIAVGSFAAHASAQTTVTLSSPGTHVNADLTIQGGAAALTDFSNSPVLASKVSSEEWTRRILLKFDTQNYIPANAVIQSAYIYLTLKKAESTEDRPFTAYWVTKSFAKGQTNWRYHRTGQAWSTRGGDLGPRFAPSHIGDNVGTAYKFDVKALVQRAVNGDFGSRYTRVALIDTGAATDGNYREFHSTRATTASVRPRLVITYGTSTSAPAADAPAPPPPPSSSTGTTLRVMQWNIHKTKGSDGVCNPDRIANGIVAQNPHVVSLNEVNFFSGDCAWNFDMGEKLRSLLQQKTGVTWYRQHYSCDGRGSILLSRIRPVADSSGSLSYDRGVAQMTIVVNGRNVNVFATHVDYYNAYYRTIQTKEVVRWAANHGEPRIIMGDFNTWPNTSDYALMATPYQDAWVAAKSAGTAWAFNVSGNTTGGSRLDYVYYSRNSVLSLQSVKVPDTRVSGVYPSDHHPVIAVFRVN